MNKGKIKHNQKSFAVHMSISRIVKHIVQDKTGLLLCLAIYIVLFLREKKDFRKNIWSQLTTKILCLLSCSESGC